MIRKPQRLDRLVRFDHVAAHPASVDRHIAWDEHLARARRDDRPQLPVERPRQARRNHHDQRVGAEHAHIARDAAHRLAERRVVEVFRVAVKRDTALKLGLVRCLHRNHDDVRVRLLGQRSELDLRLRQQLRHAGFVRRLRRITRQNLCTALLAHVPAGNLVPCGFECQRYRQAQFTETGKENPHIAFAFAVAC